MKTEFLFDLGGVLLENSCFDVLNSWFGETLDEHALRELWLKSDAMQAFDSGYIAASDFARQIVQEWQIPLTPDEFITEFVSWPTGFYAGVEAVIQQLRRNHRVSCLSNSNELHWKKFNSFAGIFDIALSSHQLGITKPHREIFYRAIDILAVSPEQIIFFDDSLPNVQVASELGMKAYHVHGFAEVLPVLSEQGCL